MGQADPLGATPLEYDAPVIRNFEEMLVAASQLPKRTVAVASAEDDQTLGAVRRVVESGLLDAVLTGRREKIEVAAEEVGLDLKSVRCIHTTGVEESASAAVREITDGRAQILMKGKLHTNELLKAAIAKEAGLRTGRTLSHVFIQDLALYPRLLFVTDGGMNIAPDEEALFQITENAVALARLFVPRPKVAMLSALEIVYEKMPSTVVARRIQDRAALEIPEADVQGPLAFDEVVSELACRRKGVTGPVAGRADVAVVPNIETGNALFKAQIYLAGARAAGLIVGGRKPIVLTSRSDSDETKFLSLGLGLLACEISYGAPGEPTRVSEAALAMAA